MLKTLKELVMTDPDQAPQELDESSGEKLSREEKRAIAAAYSQLAQDLARGKPAELPDPPFDDALRQGVLDARRFAKNAKQRQIRRLAQLLREAGSVDELRQAIEGRTPEQIAARAHESINEKWRARLLDEGDTALAEFIRVHPQADRAQLRQLMRQASRVPPDARAKKAGTQLLREIRTLRATPQDTE